MASIHQAQLSPSKLAMIATWIGAQPWWPGGPVEGLTNLGAYRFDDPAGAVGVEGIVVGRPDDTALHVVLTYRDAPLVGAEAALLGTMSHSVLGTRYVYDAASDPVAVLALAGAPQAREFVQGADGEVEREPGVTLIRSGGAVHVPADVAVGDVVASSDARTTTIDAPGLHLVLQRVLDERTGPPAGVAVLLGSWDDRAGVLLAHA